MPRRPNPTIGHVPCAFCTELGAVRKAKGGSLYYVCACGGPHYANEHVLAHGTIWGEGGPPEHLPLWIKKGLAHPPGTRNGHDRPRGPAPSSSVSSSNEPAPVADPPPAEPAPVQGSEEPAPQAEPSQGSRTSARESQSVTPRRMSFGLFR